MTPQTREARLSAAFVKLARTLTADFDVVDLLQALAEECADILDTQEAGIMLVDDTGTLQLVASTSEETNLVEVMALNAGEGPCVECFTTGIALTVGDIAHSDDRWPAFQAEALRNGFRSVHATPLRLRERVIGTLNLFSTHVGELGEEDIAVAQALADVSAIGLVQEHRADDETLITRQLQRALNSRILIEQAKGVISAVAEVDVADAFALLRTYAKDNGLTLRLASEAIIGRKVTAESLQPR